MKILQEEVDTNTALNQSNMGNVVVSLDDTNVGLRSFYTFALETLQRENMVRSILLIKINYVEPIAKRLGIK